MFLIITMLIIGAILNFFAPEQNTYEMQQAIWPYLAAGFAAKGLIDARVNQTRQNKLDDFRRAAITYSPWSGMGDPGPQSAGNTSMLGGALQGGMQGAMIGALGGQAGLWTNPTLGAAAAGETLAATQAQKAAVDAYGMGGGFQGPVPIAADKLAPGAIAGSAGALGSSANQVAIPPGSMSPMSTAQQLGKQPMGATGTWGGVAKGPAQQRLQGFLGAPINQVAPQTQMQQMYTPMHRSGLYSMSGQ